MPKGKQNDATGAICALLESHKGLLTYGINLGIEDYYRIVKMDLEKGKFSIYIYSIYEQEKKNNLRININKKILDYQREFSRKKGNKSAFIGFLEEKDIFVAWDPRHACSLTPSPGSGSSINSSLKLKHDTTERRPSIYKAKPQKMDGHAFVISMHSSMLTFYLENMEELHSMNNEEEIIYAMENGTTDVDNSSISNIKNLSEIPLSYWATYWARDPEFRKSVLKAYNNACCVCGKKLGIVQAAHIIPFYFDRKNNCVKNGLALCVEHHILYDKAILMPDHNYQLVFNEMKAKELREAGLDAGLDDIEKLDGRRIRLPECKDDWPCKDGLLEGIKARDSRAIPDL